MLYCLMENYFKFCVKCSKKAHFHLCLFSLTASLPLSVCSPPSSLTAVFLLLCASVGYQGSSFSLLSLQTCCPPTGHLSLVVIMANSLLLLSSWMSTVTASFWEGRTSCTLSCWDLSAASPRR